MITKTRKSKTKIRSRRPKRLHYSLGESVVCLGFVFSSNPSHRAAATPVVRPRKDPKRSYSQANRKPRETSRRPLKTKKLTSKQKITAMLSESCCKKLCLTYFGAQQVLNIRFANTVVGDEASITRNLTRLVHDKILLGRGVCAKAMSLLLGVSPHKMRAARSLKPGGVPAPQVRHVAARKTEFCYSFLHSYFSSCCQTMAEAAGARGHPVLRLPFYVSSGELICLLQGNWQEKNPLESPPSYNTMMRVWKSDFRHVRIPKNSEYGSCSQCYDLAEKFRTLRSRDDVVLWQREKEEHHLLHTEERKRLAARIEQVRADPTHALYLGIDNTMPATMPSLRPRLSVLSFFVRLFAFLCSRVHFNRV